MVRSCLLHGQHRQLSNIDVIRTTGGPDDFLRNVFGPERLHAHIYLVGGRLIAIGPHKTEFRLDHPRLDVGDTDGRRVQLLHQRGRKRTHGEFRRAVDRAAWIRFHTGDGAEIDDVAAIARLEHAHKQLRHLNETTHIGVEHRIHVLTPNVAHLGGAGGEACIVHKHINVRRPRRHTLQNRLDTLCVTHIEIKHRIAAAMPRSTVRIRTLTGGLHAREFLDATRAQHDIRPRVRKQLSGSSANAGRGARHEHNLVMQSRTPSDAHCGRKPSREARASLVSSSHHVIPCPPSPLASPTLRMARVADEVQVALRQLEHDERTQKHRMEALVKEATKALQQSDTVVHEHTAPPLHRAQRHAHAIESRFQSTTHTAQQLYHDLNVLYEEGNRIQLSLQWCTEAIQLRTSLGALADALERLDWDACVRHCQQASSVPADVLHSDFVRTVVPTAMHPDAPPQLLAHLRASLIDKMAQQFAHYANARDEAQATRFLAYFAAIHAHEQGLAAYSAFACSLLEAYGHELEERLRSPSANPLFFGMLWTALHEYLAVFISKHQPVVDQLLGQPGHCDFMQGVWPALERVWSSFALRILEAWRAERNVDQLVRDAQDERFTPLETIRASPYTPGRIYEHHHGGGSEYLAVDALLNEMVSFSAQWSLFMQFLRRSTLPTDAAVFDGRLARTIQDTMLHVFVPLQMYALQANVQQVHMLDTPDVQSLPYASSLPDDMFFALRTVLSRSLSTSSVDVAERIVSQAVAMVETYFVEIVVLRMDGCRRALNISRLVDGPRRAAAAREVRTTLCVYLNVLDISASYSDRILALLSQPSFLESCFAGGDADSPLAIAQGIVSRLGTLSPKIRTALQFEIDELYRALVEPRLQALLSDIFRDLNYKLNEASYGQLPEAHTLTERLRTGWDALMTGYRDQLTESNYASLFSMAVDALVRPWEQLVFQLTFTELGALRFDKDVRGVLTMLSERAPWGLRDKFLRLQQVSYVLNMDEEETDTSDAYEAGVSSGISWQLTPAEVQNVRALRVTS